MDVTGGKAPSAQGAAAAAPDAERQQEAAQPAAAAAEQQQQQPGDAGEAQPISFCCCIAGGKGGCWWPLKTLPNLLAELSPGLPWSHCLPAFPLLLIQAGYSGKVRGDIDHRAYMPGKCSTVQWLEPLGHQFIYVGAGLHQCRRCQ